MKTTNARINDSLLMALAREMTKAVVTFASSGDNTLIAAPSGADRLAIAYLKIQRNSGNTATTTILLKQGASGDQIDDLITSDDVPGGVLADAATELQLLVLPPATALIANLNGANSHKATLRYLTLQAES